MPERGERHFAGKAHAVNAGYSGVAGLEYDVIGNLDADVSFDPDYFAFLMSRFAENPKLGVGGTSFREGNTSYNYEFVGIEHVAGMCQMFRRGGFWAIGGFSSLSVGGVGICSTL